jgi:hypothetical protein
MGNTPPVANIAMLEDDKTMALFHQALMGQQVLLMVGRAIGMDGF